MKKMFALTAALYSMLCLAGCLDDEDLFPEAKEAISGDNWESFTFKSLSGHSDLQITRASSIGQDSSTEGPISIVTSYSKRPFLVIATYKKNCEFCKTQALWLDKLASDFPKQGIDFVIIFLDIFDDSDISEVQWVKKLSHVDAFTNVATVCTKNACKQILSPHHIGPTAGTIYFVDKKDLENVQVGPDWRLAENPEGWYAQTHQALENYFNLTPIVFDAGVSGWVEETPSDSTF